MQQIILMLLIVLTCLKINKLILMLEMLMELVLFTLLYRDKILILSKQYLSMAEILMLKNIMISEKRLLFIIITNILLQAGANPTIGDKRGLTALHYAARFGFKQIVKLLMTYGADINLRDNNGFNAAHWAKLNQYKEIVDMIGPARSIAPKDYQEFKNAMIQIHQITVGKKKKKKKKKK